MIKVLIADDHSIVRGGLKQLFALTNDIKVAGEATNGDEVLKILRHKRFDLLLLDLTMPGICGVNLIKLIRELNSELPILIFSMHNEFMIVKYVLQAGASGFATKGMSQDILVEAVRKVASGETFIDPVIAKHIIFNKAHTVKDQSHELLSEREFQVMKLIAMGKTINEIAEELFLNNKTVSTFKARMMRKMNFNNNADLMRYIASNDVII